MPKAVKIVGGSLLFGAVFLLTAWMLWPKSSVPSEFSEARIRGASLAKIIAASAAQSLEALTEIRVYDEKGESAQALLLISQEVIRNRETEQDAIRLSSELEKMARLLPEIKPSRARVMATEAVSAEVALVSRLVSYTNNLAELFGVLRTKFGTKAPFDGVVKNFIDKVNEDARAINSFNDRVNWSLAEFDKAFTN